MKDGRPTPEIALDCIGQGSARLTTRAESVEVELVQNHRIHRDQLLALEAVHDKHRCARQIEARELIAYPIEPLDRATIVVLV